jgi:putative methionine-R-sulfoxide reductase with GAF domain
VTNFLLAFLAYTLFRSLRKNAVKTPNEDIKSGQLTPDQQAENNLQSQIKQFKEFIDGLSGEKCNYESLFSKLASNVNAVQGALYLLKTKGENTFLQFHCGYAYYTPKKKLMVFDIGEGLIGQVAMEKKTLNLNSVPIEHLPAISGLGKSVAQYLIISPLIKDNELIGVAELSAFNPFDLETEKFIESALLLITEKLNT